MDFYKAYKKYKFSNLTKTEIKKIEEAAYNSFVNSKFALEDLEIYFKLQQKLIDLNLACKCDDEIFVEFKNKYFHIYLALEKIYENKENIFDIINNDIFLDFEVSDFIDFRNDSLRMYSK